MTEPSMEGLVAARSGNLAKANHFRFQLEIPSPGGGIAKFSPARVADRRRCQYIVSLPGILVPGWDFVGVRILGYRFEVTKTCCSNICVVNFPMTGVG